jgi:hypothetical protein
MKNRPWSPRHGTKNTVKIHEKFCFAHGRHVISIASCGEVYSIPIYLDKDSWFSDVVTMGDFFMYFPCSLSSKTW